MNMASNTFGVFKGTYKGHGLYWTSSGYNTDGGTSFSTLQALKKAIDDNEIEQQKQEDAVTTQNIASGKCILAHKNSDNSVTVTIPGNGTREYPNMERARRDVFKLEEEFDKDVVWI
jgi:hypothetical protein